MKREEEIQKLIDKEMGVDNYGSSDYQVGVYDGVKLADKTMINKACQWLKENYYNVYQGTWQEIKEQFINDFRKALEE